MTQPTPNDLDLDLPMAVQSVVESPVVMRIGTVVNVVESDNITVRISGSPVLVTASYQFPQYQPILGDRVVVIRQDSQWFVHGTMSGPINSAISNPSFELGAVAGLPTGWTLTAVSAAGGTVAFRKEPGNYLGQPISGQYLGDVVFTSNGAAAPSQYNIFSPAAPAAFGESWTPAFWVAGGVMSTDTLVFVTTFVRWLDGASALISENTAQTFAYLSGVISPVYMRPQVGTTSFLAPSGTAYVQIRFNVQFAMTVPLVGTISELFLDHVILRNVT